MKLLQMRAFSLCLFFIQYTCPTAEIVDSTLKHESISEDSALNEKTNSQEKKTEEVPQTANIQPQILRLVSSTRHARTVKNYEEAKSINDQFQKELEKIKFEANKSEIKLQNIIQKKTERQEQLNTLKNMPPEEKYNYINSSLNQALVDETAFENTNVSHIQEIEDDIKRLEEKHLLETAKNTQLKIGIAELEKNLIDRGFSIKEYAIPHREALNYYDKYKQAKTDGDKSRLIQEMKAKGYLDQLYTYAEFEDKDDKAAGELHKQKKTETLWDSAKYYIPAVVIPILSGLYIYKNKK